MEELKKWLHKEIERLKAYDRRSVGDYIGAYWEVLGHIKHIEQQQKDTSEAR